MIASDGIHEQPILLVTSQSETIMPLMAVMRNVFHHHPMLVRPQEAASVVLTQRINLILVDMQSNRDSMSLVREFKERFAQIPLIVIVPYGDVSVIERAVECGADDYISQPISLERLKITMRNALRLRLLLATKPEGAAGENRRLALMLETMGKLKTLKEIEDAVIEHAIESCAGCITQAARALGIGRSTLYRKIHEKSGAPGQISRENHTTRPMIAASSSVDS